jgi:hypothetical protein
VDRPRRASTRTIAWRWSAGGGVRQIRPRPHLHLLTFGNRDVADARRDGEHFFVQIAHDHLWIPAPRSAARLIPRSIRPTTTAWPPDPTTPSRYSLPGSPRKSARLSARQRAPSADGSIRKTIPYREKRWRPEITRRSGRCAATIRNPGIVEPTCGRPHPEASAGSACSRRASRRGQGAEKEAPNEARVASHTTSGGAATARPCSSMDARSSRSTRLLSTMLPFL